MTPEQVTLVQSSFAAVKPISEQAADLFYDRLFAIAPEVRPMFPGELAEQKQKLMAMLATVVGNLHQIETMMPAVEALGRRHRGYGASEAHYQPVGEALIWTLGEGLGPAFTPDTKAAWIAAYTTLAGAMQRG